MQIQILKQLDFFKNQKLLSLDLLPNQGYCNINYKLHTTQSDYLVRKFKSNDTVNISRSFEFRTQKQVSMKNIAPTPFLLNKKNSFMITEFTKGIHKSKLHNLELIKLVKTVKKFHSIKVNTKEYNLKKDFNYYSQLLQDKNSQYIINQSFKELAKLKQFKKELVLTHHDLNPKNIIFTTNSIKIIDWEYAGANDLFFDLASLCCEFKLSKKEEILLLKTYFQKSRVNDIDKLNSYKIIYQNLCLLWFKSLEKN